jgi:hypothetical protein
MSEPVVWRRVNVPSACIGDADVSGAALRLSGREPVSGVEISLAIPFSEIERVRTSRTAAEELGGEPSVVLELTASPPVCLRATGTRATLPVRLGRMLGNAVSSHTRPAGMRPAALGGDSR